MSNKKTHEVEIIEDGQLFILKIDTDTGDVLSKTPAIKRRNSKNYFEKGEFYTVHKRFDMFMLEKYHEYNKLEFGVLCWLRSNIGFNNRVESFRQKDIAVALGTNQSHISRALKKLEIDEIIKKDGYHYIFTPKYVRYAFDSDVMEKSK